MYEGISLNSVLMLGPDLTNTLDGIQMRFRKDAIGVTGTLSKCFMNSVLINLTAIT